MAPPARENLRLRRARAVLLRLTMAAGLISPGTACADEPAPPIVFGALAPGPTEQTVRAPAWTLGPAVGGGVLFGVTVEVQANQNVWVESTFGMRPGMSASTLYPNVALSAGVNTGFGKKLVKHGFFANVGASAPIGFFDAWLAGGWSMEMFTKRGIRSTNLQIGPALYLIRDMPPETNLTWPAFLYLKAAWPFELGRPR